VRTVGGYSGPNGNFIAVSGGRQHDGLDNDFNAVLLEFNRGTNSWSI